MTTATTLGFVAKRIHTALRAQVGVCARLEVVIVVVTWLTGSFIAWATVVELAGWALATLAAMSLRAIATACVAVGVAWWAIAQGFCAWLAIACRSVTHAVAADMAVGARGSAAFATWAATATASGLVVTDALHHFTACGFGCSSHHVAAWWLA